MGILRGLTPEERVELAQLEAAEKAQPVPLGAMQ